MFCFFSFILLCLSHVLPHQMQVQDENVSEFPKEGFEDETLGEKAAKGLRIVL